MSELTESTSFEHPSWCIRPSDEAQLGCHVSRTIRCQTSGLNIIGVAVRLNQIHPPSDDALPPWVTLEITEGRYIFGWPIELDQVILLRRALATLEEMAGTGGPS